MTTVSLPVVGDPGVPDRSDHQRRRLVELDVLGV